MFDMHRDALNHILLTGQSFAHLAHHRIQQTGLILNKAEYIGDNANTDLRSADHPAMGGVERTVRIIGTHDFCLHVRCHGRGAAHDRRHSGHFFVELAPVVVPVTPVGIFACRNDTGKFRQFSI